VRAEPPQIPVAEIVAEEHCERNAKRKERPHNVGEEEEDCAENNKFESSPNAKKQVMQPNHGSDAHIATPLYGNPILGLDQGELPVSSTTSGEEEPSPLIRTRPLGCVSVEHGDAQQALADTFLSGGYLVEKLMHNSGDVVWAAADASPAAQEATGTTTFGGVGAVAARTFEAAGLPKAKSSHPNQENGTASEQASHEKWGRVIQDLRAAYNTVTFWNLLFVGICIRCFVGTSTESGHLVTSTLLGSKHLPISLVLVVLADRFGAIDLSARSWRILIQFSCAIFPCLIRWSGIVRTTLTWRYATIHIL
jgi:hypothetical protein